jgi:hypothetical protein
MTPHTTLAATHTAASDGAKGGRGEEALPISRWKSSFLEELDAIATRDRWGRALVVIGWFHLAAFLICQRLYTPVGTRDLRFLWTWGAEFLLTIGAFRLVAGPGWYRAAPAAGLIVRIWVTFFILALSMLSLNNLTGWETPWFKLGWATLSSFGFAMLAWLIDLRFLLLAVQMWLTGLLMLRFPHVSYLIYGISWWMLLEGMGIWLERRSWAIRETSNPAPSME